MVFGKRTFHGELPVMDHLHPAKAREEQKLSEAIAAAGGIDGSDVEVIWAADGVHLKGTVLSTQTLENCLTLARQTGAPVINELRVVTSKG